MRSADEALDRTVFDPRSESVEHSIHFGFYGCRHCSEVIRFRYRDFRGPTDTQFSDSDRARFDEFLHQTSISFEPPARLFLVDFYCPNCGAPVRLVVTGFEFAMDAEKYSVEYVIEDTQAPAA